MPTFTAGPGGIDMSQLLYVPRYASASGNSTQLTFLMQNQDLVVLTGQFTISNGTVAAANINQIQYYLGGSTLGFTISNASLGLSGVADLEGAGGGVLSQFVQDAMKGSSTYVGSSANDVLLGMWSGPNTFIGGSGTEVYDLNLFSPGTNTITGGSGTNVVVDSRITGVTLSGGVAIIREQTATSTGTNLSYIEGNGGGLTYVVAAKVHNISENSWAVPGAPITATGEGATILFQDNFSNYTIQSNGHGVYIVTDLIAGHDGVTTVDASVGGVAVSPADGVFPWVLQFADKSLSGNTAIAAASTIVTTVTNPTGQQTTLFAPTANTVVMGAGYDILSLAGKASSAYTLTSNGDGSATIATSGSSDHVSGVMQVAFADKTVTLAANQSGNEYVALLYQAALGRAPDSAGLAYWEKTATSLAAGQAAAALAPSFTHSAEFISKYGPLTDAQFVNQMYLNVLDRAADSGGSNYWTAQMAAGLSRELVLAAFAVSPEDISNATTGFVGQSGAHPSWLFLT